MESFGEAATFIRAGTGIRMEACFLSSSLIHVEMARSTLFSFFLLVHLRATSHIMSPEGPLTSQLPPSRQPAYQPTSLLNQAPEGKLKVEPFAPRK